MTDRNLVSEFTGRLVRLVLPAILLLFTSSAWALQNQLKDHASPYLALHGNDPVAWQDWSRSILEQAKKEDKLIFISSGYFSCHWCHVMQRESYSDPQIAAVLNKYFIPVKVDRELNPALDAYLIDYLERTQGRAGWPLNMFLTPEGYPLVGATYLPPKQFLQVLNRLGTAWQGESGRIRDLARQALLELTADNTRKQAGDVDVNAVRQQFVREALALGDPMEGGFGDQNKFPLAPQLIALLTIDKAFRGKDLDHLVNLTLEQMAGQGLRDQLGGGFFRYSIDPSWHVPHFEKMLYTQALLARVYLKAGEIYGRQKYLDVARDTLDFVLREMRGRQGLFISSFSAVDEAGEEGAYYLWRPEELPRLVGERDVGVARRHFGMFGSPTLEGVYLPRHGESVSEIAESLGQAPAQISTRIAAIKAMLLVERGNRSLPADTKELTAWNGLLLGTLAMAAGQLEEPAYLDAARDLASKIKAQLWKDGRLWRARLGDRQLGQASLADYAYLAQGLGYLAAVTDDPETGQWRDQLIEAAWQRFHDSRGWRIAEIPPLPGMGSAQASQDGALPAAPAALIEAAMRSGNQKLVGLAKEALQQALAELQERPFWFASYLAVSD